MNEQPHDQDYVASLLKQHYSLPEPAVDFVSDLRAKSEDEVGRRTEMTTAPKKRRETVRFLPAAAGIVTIAAVLIIAAFFHFGSRRQAMAFDEVVDRLDRVRTVKLKEITTFPGKAPQEVQVSIVAPHLRRNDNSDGTSAVIDLRRGKMLTLIPKEKSARIQEIEPMPEANLIGQLIDPFAALSSAGEATPIISSASVPGKSIDGKRVTGLLIKFKHVKYESDGEMTVWADEKTGLPVRIEMLLTYSGSLLKKIKDKHGTIQITVVLKDFVFDQPVDKGKFHLDAPTGYEVHLDPRRQK